MIEDQITRAIPTMAARLTDIAIAAKRHWQYSETWIERWHGQLTILPEYIAANTCFIACFDGIVVGFAGVRNAACDASLDHLWVLPNAMGRGLGRRLFITCEAEARQAGRQRLLIQSDPNAEGFYLKMGAVVIGHTESPLDGCERRLPLLEKKL